MLDLVANRQARNGLLQSIHEALRELGEALSTPFETPAMQSLCVNLSEGLAALLMAADEAVHSCDADDLALLRQLTADRDSLVDQLRRRVIAADRMLSTKDQLTLYTITSLFERVVWMLRRYGALLAIGAARRRTLPRHSLRGRSRHCHKSPDSGRLSGRSWFQSGVHRRANTTGSSARRRG